jgi:hypothetical protein
MGNPRKSQGFINMLKISIAHDVSDQDYRKVEDYLNRRAEDEDIEIDIARDEHTHLTDGFSEDDLHMQIFRDVQDIIAGED